MKKTALLGLFLAFSVAAMAQSARTVLLEHFTNASCGPCAVYNPLVKQYFGSTNTNVIAIKYQVWWPGTDPMYNHNTADVQNRVSYYSVTGVPNSVIDGNVAQGNPGTLFAGGNCPTMDSRAAVAAPFDIVVTHDLSSDYGTTNITAVLTASQAVANANLKAHVVIVEKQIDFATAPGSNGETQFNYVMKKMLPSATGTDLQDVWAAGNTQVLTQSWSLANVYNLAQLAVVVFVQDDVTKEVFQAGYSEFITPPNANDAAIISADATGTGSSVVICNPAVNPSVTLLNFGSSALTSADINYSINGQSATYNWTGNLASLATTEVSLPAVAYSPNATFNQFIATVGNPNGSTDPYAGNNSDNGFFDYVDYNNLTGYGSTLTLNLTTDDYGGETSWDVKDASGNVVASGDNYGDNATVTETINLPDGQCYRFTIYDSYGDGICCQYGNGQYSLTDASGTVLIAQASGSNPFNGSSSSKNFRTNNTVSTEEVSLAQSLNVYPNPADDNFTVAFELAEATALQINLVNAIGQTIRTISNDNFNSGAHNLNVNATGLATGTYFITIRSNEGMTDRKSVV